MGLATPPGLAEAEAKALKAMLVHLVRLLQDPSSAVNMADYTTWTQQWQTLLQISLQLPVEAVPDAWLVLRRQWQRQLDGW